MLFKGEEIKVIHIATERPLIMPWVSPCVYGLFNNKGAEILIIFSYILFFLKSFFWVLREVLAFCIN